MSNLYMRGPELEGHIRKIILDNPGINNSYVKKELSKQVNFKRASHRRYDSVCSGQSIIQIAKRLEDEGRIIIAKREKGRHVETVYVVVDNQIAANA